MDLSEKIRKGLWQNPDLEKVDLSGANLRYANLHEAQLNYCNLYCTDLRGASLSGAKLRGANMTNADLQCTDLRDADLYMAILQGANLTYSDLRGTKFQVTDIRDTNLSDCLRLETDPILTGWILVAGRLQKEVERPKKKDNEMKDVLSLIQKIKENSWQDSDLRKANLSGANLFRAALSGADLSGADLFRADLSKANLSGANLSKANLSGANLSGADLSGANLFRADLSGAERFKSDPEIPGWENKNGFLRSAEKTKEKDIEVKEVKTDTETKKDIEAFAKECDNIRIYSGILPNAIEISKNLLRLGIRLGLKALGKTGEVIRSWIVIAEDFLDSHKDIADNVFRWLLGWGSKNLHQLRKLPGVKDLEFLSFLESPEIQKFGMFVEANTEGAALGDLAKKAMEWIQQWIFGSATAIRIGEAFSDPKQLVRIVAEMNFETKEALRKEIETESEASEAEKKSKALAMGMVTA